MSSVWELCSSTAYLNHDDANVGSCVGSDDDVIYCHALLTNGKRAARQTQRQGFHQLRAVRYGACGESNEPSSAKTFVGNESRTYSGCSITVVRGEPLDQVVRTGGACNGRVVEKRGSLSRVEKKGHHGHRKLSPDLTKQGNTSENRLLLKERFYKLSKESEVGEVCSNSGGYNAYRQELQTSRNRDMVRLLEPGQKRHHNQEQYLHRKHQHKHHLQPYSHLHDQHQHNHQQQQQCAQHHQQHQNNQFQQHRQHQHKYQISYTGADRFDKNGKPVWPGRHSTGEEANSKCVSDHSATADQRQERHHRQGQQHKTDLSKRTKSTNVSTHGVRKHLRLAVSGDQTRTLTSDLTSSLGALCEQKVNTSCNKSLVGIAEDRANESNNKFACFSGEEDPRRTDERFYGGIGSPRLGRYENRYHTSDRWRRFHSPSSTPTAPHRPWNVADDVATSTTNLFYSPTVPSALENADVLGVSTNDPTTGRRLAQHRTLPYGTFKAVSLLLESPKQHRRTTELPVFVTPHDRPPLATRLQPFVPFDTPQPTVTSQAQTKLSMSAEKEGEAEGEKKEEKHSDPPIRHPPIQFKPNFEKDAKGPLPIPFDHPGIVWPLAFANMPPYSTPGHEVGGVKQPVGVIQTGVVPKRPLKSRAWDMDADIPAWVSPLYKTYGIGGPYGQHGPFAEPCLLGSEAPWEAVLRQAEALGALGVPGVLSDCGRVDFTGLCSDFVKAKEEEERLQAEALRAKGACRPCRAVKNFFAKVKAKLGIKPKPAEADTKKDSEGKEVKVVEREVVGAEGGDVAAAAAPAVSAEGGEKSSVADGVTAVEGGGGEEPDKVEKAEKESAAGEE